MTSPAPLLEDDSIVCGVDWSKPTTVVSVIALVALNFTVIAGNGLVIAAVATSARLRTTTHLFIASLAVADLLIGIAVLPFSSTLQLTGNWLFGTIWCSVWLAVDVWVCTASILNLCAISLDRYLAITRPVNYLSIMTTRRARALCAAVWFLAFVIALPPLIAYTDSMVKSSDSACQVTECAIVSEKGYVVYSALGSFFLPCFIMLFFYWRIYRAAAAQTKSISKGFKTIGRNSHREPGGGENVTLRIHRGRPSQYGRDPVRTASTRHARSRSHQDLRGQDNPRLKRTQTYQHANLRSAGRGSSSTLLRPDSLSSASGHLLPGSRAERPPVPSPSPESIQPDCLQEVGELGDVLETGEDRHSRVGANRLNLRAHARRFRIETKAAKTLAIIIGVFILCWLPFFSLYLARGFCENCISVIVFDLFFWLGYCNSAMNPVLYACFSQDFRNAFKRLLYKLACWSTNKPRRGVTISFHNYCDGGRERDQYV